MSSPYTTDDKKDMFIKHLAASGNVTEAARNVGIHRRTTYAWKQDDEDFAAEWAAAELDAADVLLNAARNRAVDGVPEPVFYEGEVCGHKQRYSDSLMALLLKAHHPAFKEEKTVVLVGEADNPVVVTHQVDTDKAIEIASILADVGGLGEPDSTDE